MIFKLMDKIKDQESQRFELVQILRGSETARGMNL